MSTWSSSAAQPIEGWQQGQHFAALPFSSNFFHRGKQRLHHSPYNSATLRSSNQSTQAVETLQFQDELSELMMGDAGCQLNPHFDPFASDNQPNQFQWTGEASWCGDAITSSLDGSIMASSDYAMSSLDSTAPSPQEPNSPEVHPWRTHQVEPHIRRDSMNDTVPPGLPGQYNQFSSYGIASQNSKAMLGGEEHKMVPTPMPDLINPCHFNTSPTLTIDDCRPAWSNSPGFNLSDNLETSVCHDDDPSLHRIRWYSEASRSQSSLRAEQDKLIVEGKRRNMSYKEIKEHYKIEGAVSTLRGRYRAAVKPKNQRVRKPEWKPKDVSWPGAPDL